MLPSEFKLLLKDTLRGARFAVRHSLRSPILPVVLSRTQLTGFADRVMTTLESGIVGNLEHVGLVNTSVAAAMNDLRSLLTCATRDGFEARLHRACYTLAKAALKAAGVDNAYIAEHHYQTVARTLIPDPQQSAAEFFAQLSVRVAGAEPVRLIDKTEAGADLPVLSDPNRFAAFSTGLAGTVYAMNPDSNPEECFNSAVEVVMAASAQFLSAMQSASPAERLAQLYTDMAEFLP